MIGRRVDPSGASKMRACNPDTKESARPGLETTFACFRPLISALHVTRHGCFRPLISARQSHHRRCSFLGTSWVLVAMQSLSMKSHSPVVV